MSEFFFFLTRNAEILNFGEIQTWRGINSHYEIFSNLQLFIFCFMLLNYFLNKSVKNYLLILIPLASLMLSQSRFTTLVFFVILGITFINFGKKYLKEFIVIFIILILTFQAIPTFDRTEPFFVEPTDPNVITTKQVNVYNFKPLSDRLNRTVPWTFFLSGYEPNNVELIFGHGTGAYLNIVKLTDEKPVSGPHSLIFQILNKFGLLGIVVFVSVYLLFIKHIIARKKLLIQLYLAGILILLLGLEIKTDSIMLVSGVAVFYFNFLLGFLFEKIYSLEIEK
jgi:O-antigen ligase